jgi:Neurochondrin
LYYKALSPDPNWLKLLSSLIQETVFARPTLNTRKWCTLISSALLQLYPQQFPYLLFQTSSKGEGKQPAASALEPKPFAYLFVSLILIDIRATIPSLLELLASPEYPTTAERLSAGFNVVAAFVGFLVRSLDEDVGGDSRGLLFQIEPDLLLKLRRDIAETMGLTVEFLRDRWDGVTGSGLGGDSQPPPAKQKIPLSLTWDTRDGGILQDHLVLAAIRALALWLREDENETLRREASGITDVFLGLYAQSNSIGVKNPTVGVEPRKAITLDFRPALLTAFEGITATDDGVEAFLEANGWEVLWHHDLAKLLSANAKSEEDISRGIEIIRVLLAVIEHGRNGETSAKEEWMDVVKAAATLSPEDSALELHLSLFQLAVELLTRAPRALRRQFVGEARVIAERARRMLEAGGDEGLRDGAVEVLEGLEVLGIAI